MAFAVNENEIDSWRRHLQQRGVAIEAEVAWPEGGRSIYFRDPAGNVLELAPPALWILKVKAAANRWPVHEEVSSYWLSVAIAKFIHKVEKAYTESNPIGTATACVFSAGPQSR